MRLKWTRTGLGNPDDYTAADVDHPHAFCRVYQTHGSSSSLPWFWAASDGFIDLGHGYAATAREAADLAETAYFNRRDRVANVDRDAATDR